MKGGIALALGVMRALAAVPESFAELGLLAVVDEEWRTGGFGARRPLRRLRRLPVLRGRPARPRRGGGGGRQAQGRRDAAGASRAGSPRTPGSAPEKGRNALLALGEAARLVAAGSDPAGPDRLTAMPDRDPRRRRVQRRPRRGRARLRPARRSGSRRSRPCSTLVPPSVDGVELEAALVRRWPGMDSPRARSPSGSSSPPLRLLSAAADRRRARRRQRRQPPGRRRRAHRRRARAARRARPPPGRVRRRRLGSPAGRDRARGRGSRRSARP